MLVRFKQFKTLTVYGKTFEVLTFFSDLCFLNPNPLRNHRTVHQEKLVHTFITLINLVGSAVITYLPFSSFHHKLQVYYSYFPFRVHSIYTHFRNKMEKNCEVRPEIDSPTTLPPLPDDLDVGVIPSVTDFNISGNKLFIIS